MFKTKSEKMHQNQKDNKNIPKGVNAICEVKMKQHTKRVHQRNYSLLNASLMSKSSVKKHLRSKKHACC